MSVYEIRIKNTRIYFTQILVSAKSEVKALKYCRDSHEWEEDLSISEESRCLNVMEGTKIEAVSAKKIIYLTEKPKGYSDDCILWNSNGTKRLKDILIDN